MSELEKIFARIPVKDLKDNILVVKVGNEDRFASDKDIRQVRKQMQKVVKGIKGVSVIVTHHAINFEVLAKDENKDITRIIEQNKIKNENKNPMLIGMDV